MEASVKKTGISVMPSEVALWISDPTRWVELSDQVSGEGEFPWKGRPGAKALERRISKGGLELGQRGEDHVVLLCWTSQPLLAHIFKAWLRTLLYMPLSYVSAVSTLVKLIWQSSCLNYSVQPARRDQTNLHSPLSLLSWPMWQQQVSVISWDGMVRGQAHMHCTGIWVSVGVQKHIL